jgi:hypothetical protein
VELERCLRGSDAGVGEKGMKAYDYLITGALLLIFSVTVGFFLWEMWG